MSENIKYSNIVPYVTKDSSVIRELIHPLHYPGARQSLAEATIAPGGQTLLHLHREVEEIYHVTGGRGRMSLGEEEFEIAEGDTVYIPPGISHKLFNQGKKELRVLCCCSPPYSHEDTVILE